MRLFYTYGDYVAVGKVRLTGLRVSGNKRPKAIILPGYHLEASRTPCRWAYLPINRRLFSGYLGRALRWIRYKLRLEQHRHEPVRRVNQESSLTLNILSHSIWIGSNFGLLYAVCSD